MGEASFATWDGAEPVRELRNKCTCLQKTWSFTSQEPEEQLCLNFGVERGSITRCEGGSELRLSGNHSLHPSNLSFPSGHQTSFQFRVLNQSYQATTEGSADPGTVSGLKSEIHKTPAPVGLTLFPKEGVGGNRGLRPDLPDTDPHRVHEPSRLKPPPNAGGRGAARRDPPPHPPRLLSQG